MIRALLLALALAAPAHADTFFRETETGTVRGGSGSDLIELGHGPGSGIGCGGRDFISGGDDRPLQPWQQKPEPGDDPDDDGIYGDGGPNGECAGSSGPDILNCAGGDICFGGLGADTYIMRGLRYPEFAQIDQFNLSRDRLLTVAAERMALVDATVVNRVVMSDWSVRGRLMALELRAPDYGPVEGSGHWVLVRLATGEQPLVTIPAGGTVLNAPDVERYRRRVLGL